MKKILTVLLATAMIAALPANVFADELELTNASTTGTITLSATKASSYTVKLPKVVDVSSLSTGIDIFAKGDVDGSKKLAIEETDAGENYLKDEAGIKQDKLLSVTAAYVNGEDITSDYGQSKNATLVVAHEELDAGAWKCELPILIRLLDIE